MLLRSVDIAQRLNCSTRTVQRWAERERIGQPVMGGWRVFTEEDYHHLAALIRAARKREDEK